MQHSVVGVMMVQGERIFILILKVNKLFSLFFIAAFSIRNRKHMFSMSLLSKRKTLESLGELEKEVEQSPLGSCSHSISCSTKLPFMVL